MTEASVRPFATRDAPALAAIYRECLSEASWLPPASGRTADFSADTQGERLLVAVAADDEPQGFVSVWEPEAFIHHLYVRRLSRGQKIGGLLLDSLRGWLPKPWRLKCLCANRAALAFYSGRGWRKICIEDGPDGPFVLLENR
ncbi:MAG TPA: GNAT family N-acetyltransferase [Burkholderiales bacterium]